MIASLKKPIRSLMHSKHILLLSQPWRIGRSMDGTTIAAHLSRSRAPAPRCIGPLALLCHPDSPRPRRLPFRRNPSPQSDSESLLPEAPKVGARHITPPFFCSAAKSPAIAGLFGSRTTVKIYGLMICVGCDPFATATAHVGNPEAGKGVFCTCANPPLCGFSCIAETVFARLFDV